MSDQQVELVALHRNQEYIPECVRLLNAEWPRSEAARTASLEQSRDELPLSLILLMQASNHENSSKTLIGHVKLKRNLPCKKSVLIESLIVDNIWRGKGYGKLIMELTQSIVRDMGFNEIVLTTIDKIGFYESLGYKLVREDKPLQQVGTANIERSLNIASTSLPPPLPPLPPQANVDKQIDKKKHEMRKII